MRFCGNRYKRLLQDYPRAGLIWRSHTLPSFVSISCSLKVWLSCCILRLGTGENSSSNTKDYASSCQFNHELFPQREMPKAISFHSPCFLELDIPSAQGFLVVLPLSPQPLMSLRCLPGLQDRGSSNAPLSNYTTSQSQLSCSSASEFGFS